MILTLVEYSLYKVIEIIRVDNIISYIRGIKLNITKSLFLSNKSEGILYYLSSLSSVYLSEYLLSNELRGKESSD